jgi:hypothetical protein
MRKQYGVKRHLFAAHWVLVVMDQYTRRIIGFGIQAGVVE